MVEKKNRAVIGILLLVVFFFLILVIFATYTVEALKGSKNFDDDGKGGTIAVVEITGVILDAKETIEKLVKAHEAKDVRAIFIRIESPGGAVAPVQEIYDEIVRIDQEKPVYASIGSVAASGGYYIAAATRKIFSSPGSLVGSIGVILPHVDMTSLFEWIKLKPSPIKAGKFKDIASNSRPMTAEEKTILENMLNDVHKQFIEDILKKRKNVIKKDPLDYAEGQIFSGRQAQNLGLVDELLGLWGAGRKVHKELNLSGEFGFRYIKKKKESRLIKLMDDLAESLSNLDPLAQQNSPMYLMKR